jgi:putative glutamine amidotransferase
MRTVLPRKTVTFDQDSRLAKILRCNPCRVNALHHQSVDKLGEGLCVVGHDEAGVVQAVEGEGTDFLFGVQWHPELLVLSRPQQRLYRALAAAARDWGETGSASRAHTAGEALEMAG